MKAKNKNSTQKEKTNSTATEKKQPPRTSRKEKETSKPIAQLPAFIQMIVMVERDHES